jgi:putative ABC transport system permease protein
MSTLFAQLRDLWSERSRIGLVALGVAWGTLSLSLLIAFGNSFVKEVNQTISNFGDDLLRVGSGSTSMPFDGFPAGRFIGLVPEDEALLLAGVPEARAIGLEYSRGANNPIRFGNVRMNVALSGCGPQFRELRGMLPQAGGRFLNEKDVELHRRVCFLGHRVKQALFGDADAVGEELELHGIPYTVVGVRQPNVSVSGYNGDDRDKVMIPHTSFKDLLGWTRISFLMIGLKDDSLKEEALVSIRSVLGARYRFNPADEDALDIQDYIALQDMIHGMLDGNRYFNGMVGFFGLMVAMLGVMNVMYVMVEERTREIGVQMAIGARPVDITRERLLEGVIVTLVGGGVGLVLTILIFAGINSMPMDPEARAYIGYPQLSLGLSCAIMIILTASGCIAAWYPARRAAALDPVQALREE